MFQKGYDPKRNNKGRPGIHDSAAAIAREMLEGPRFKGDKVLRIRAIMKKMADMAEEGSVSHATVLFDRAYGKPTENLNVKGEMSLYEQGVSEAARFVQEAGREKLLKEIGKLVSGAKK